MLYPLIWAFICLYETYHYYHTGGHYGHSKADNTVPDDLPPDVESLIFYFVYLPCTGSAALINLGVPDVIIELLSIGIPFVVPSLICMVCCGIQSQALLKKNEMTCDENLKRQQQITVTIFQVRLPSLYSRSDYRHYIPGQSCLQKSNYPRNNVQFGDISCETC